MPDTPTYIPTFRSRQQENIVLSEFNFGEFIYPMIEIIKPYDRKRPPEKQKPFQTIYTELINSITANRVFVDLPLSLTRKGSMKQEVLSFFLSVIRNLESRTNRLNELAEFHEKVIPVLSSYLTITGQADSLTQQKALLDDAYSTVAFRTHYTKIMDDWDEIIEVSNDGDYLIVDFDTLAPYPSPVVKKLREKWRTYAKGDVIILRSSINMDITNVGLDHDDIVFEVDNGLLDMYKGSLDAQAFGDYAGIKKDDLTTGGTISPGFLWYDPTENQFTGFKGNIKDLGEFESTIIPALIDSQATHNMQASELPYLEGNQGWEIIQSISNGIESGKSQAKFKKIAMLHYLYCLKVRIEAGKFDQTE